MSHLNKTLIKKDNFTLFNVKYMTNHRIKIFSIRNKMKKKLIKKIN